MSAPIRLAFTDGEMGHQVIGCGTMPVPFATRSEHGVALVQRDDAATSAVTDIVRSFFSNSKTALAVRLMEAERPSQDELASIKALIAKYEKENS